ncbi:MAG: hypothetical protein R3F37_14150 [Candidatus Competibacteraceae bacterium]
MGMLLMGSIGLIGLGREHKLELDHLNDLAALSMPPFHDTEQATSFINALVAGSEVRGWERGALKPSWTARLGIPQCCKKRFRR